MGGPLGSRGKDRFWIALSYARSGPQEAPAQWVVSINYDPGLNLAKRLFHKPDQQAPGQLRYPCLAEPVVDGYVYTPVGWIPTPGTSRAVDRLAKVMTAA